MSELQAAIEFQVELGKFYNVDLFQRGYYQIRTSLKMSPKVTAKVDVSLSKETECRLVMPGFVANGVAVSKTFQILYRKEDIDINDVFTFKVYMLVDMLKIDESIADADFQLNLELCFSEESISQSQQEKLQCLNQRSLKLHFVASKGIHHFVPLLFDYFHLSSICLTVHGTLIALHQPYISLSRSQPRASLKADQSLESALFGSSLNVTASSRNSFASSISRKHLACQRHKQLCHILLSAYESIQTSFENLTVQIPNKLRVKIEHVDCRSKLEEFSKKCKTYASNAEEEDLFQMIQSDLAALCSQNVILWMQYLELVTLNDDITYQLAKEHHNLRVKRFSEGFFINEYPKQEMIACYDPNIHGHVEIANQIRDSMYFQMIPSLAVECTDVDGDSTTMPIIFEDVYSEPMLENAVRLRPAEPGSKVLMRKANRDSTRSNNRESCYSDVSSTSGESSVSKKSSKRKFMPNLKPESFRRPSSYMQVKDQVAVDSVDCTLVGYRKLDQINAVPTPPVELGTLNTANPSLPEEGSDPVFPFLYSALSLPTLAGQSHAALNCSGSLPDLALTSSLMQAPSWRKFDGKVRAARSSSSCGSCPDIRDNVDGGCFLVGNLASARYDGDETLRLESSDTSGSQNSTAIADNASPTQGSSVEQSGEVMSAETTMTIVSESVEIQREKSDSQVSFNGSNAKGAVDQNVIKDEDAVSKSSRSSSLVTQPVFSCGPTDQELAFESVRPKDTDASKGLDVEDVRVNLMCNENNVQSAKSDRTDCNQQSASGQCIAVELVKDEEDRNRTDENKSSSSSSSLSDANSNSKGKEAGKSSSGSETTCALDVVKSCARNGLSSAASSSNSVTEKPQRLVDEVSDSIVQFISAKEMLRKQLDLREHFYSDFPSQISSFPYFTPLEKCFPIPDEGIHLVVCVHGLDGNSTDLRLVRTYLELALPNNKIEFLMSERNQVDTFADFEVMTDRLVQEILYHIELYGIKPARISFIGHSLGNLIIRSAMSRPQMTELLPKLHTFLSLSGPHLGTLFNSSGLVNMGMWLMQKWKKSGSLLQLSLKDHHDPRQTFLYKLSQKTGLEFFRNILLVGSQQDRYVPFHSSRIELCKAAVRDSSGWGAVYTEMVNNILQPIIYKSDINFIRYDVFHALSGTTNHLIGRAAHIAVLDSELFIEKFITVAALKYFI